MRLGFVCAWEPGWPEATWSRTPWSLRVALRDRIDVVDVDPGVPLAARPVLKALYMRRLPRGWSSTWKWSRPAESWVETRMRRMCAKSGLDAAVHMGDYGITATPFFPYLDLTFSLLDRYWDQYSESQWIDRGTIRRRADRQRRVLEQAAGTLTISQWLADEAVAMGDVDPGRVRVVGEGVNVAPDPGWRPPEREASDRYRLLFVGREFHRKGGDVVLDALRTLRAEHDGRATLTVIGPEKWPLRTGPPPGVTFLGRLSFDQVRHQFASHDLFVMPSRFDPSPHVLTEALAHGMPCVTRRAFALSEPVRAGENGALVDDLDAPVVAAAVQGVLVDDTIYETCRREMGDVLYENSWSRTAEKVLDAVRELGPG